MYVKNHVVVKNLVFFLRAYFRNLIWAAVWPKYGNLGIWAPNLQCRKS